MLSQFPLPYIWITWLEKMSRMRRAAYYPLLHQWFLIPAATVTLTPWDQIWWTTRCHFNCHFTFLESSYIYSCLFIRYISCFYIGTDFILPATKHCLSKCISPFLSTSWWIPFSLPRKWLFQSMEANIYCILIYPLVQSTTSSFSPFQSSRYSSMWLRGNFQISLTDFQITWPSVSDLNIPRYSQSNYVRYVVNYVQRYPLKYLLMVFCLFCYYGC